MKKRRTSQNLKLSTIHELARKFTPGAILKTLAKEYKKYPRKSKTDAEYEFWIKVSRSTANLASGMEKWVEEWLDEEDEDAGK